MKNEKFNKTGPLNGLLTMLNPDLVDYSKATEKEAIIRIVAEDTAIATQSTLAEGREVLAMEPFPWEWVGEISGLCVYDDETKKWVDDDLVLYRKWLKKVLDILEEEARKQGKLTS